MQHGTKKTSRGGRPREFDEDEALEKMLRQLWTTGLSGVSVDGIARSAGLNRPSLAAAFGDKNAIYAQAAARFAEMMDERLGRALDNQDLEAALRSAFDTAIDVYTARGRDGCFVICTAPAEALTNPVCRDILVQAIDGMDAIFLRRLAREAKLVPGKRIDLPMIAAQLAATLQSIALRARAGWKPDRLRRLAASAIAQAMAAFSSRLGRPS